MNYKFNTRKKTFTLEFTRTELVNIQLALALAIGQGTAHMDADIKRTYNDMTGLTKSDLDRLLKKN